MGANRRAGTIRQDSANLGRYQAAVDRALEEIQEDRVIERVWEHDHTVWKPEPDEISNRLGWLRSPEETPGALLEIEALVEAVRADGIPMPFCSVWAARASPRRSSGGSSGSRKVISTLRY
jgi:hypothetical protein